MSGPPVGWRVPAALAAAVALLWAPTLAHPFVYDDKIEVVGNPTIRVLTEWSAVATYNYARPLLIATYALNWAWGGFSPVGYHVVSIAIHALNVVLAYRLVGRFLPVERAALAAAAWGLHPMVTEGVTYIAGRSDALCATWWLVALGAWVDHARGRRGPGLAWAAVVAGLLTKEVAVLLPAALLAAHLLVLRRPLDRAAVRGLAAPVVLVGVAGLVRVLAYGVPRPEVERALLDHVGSQAVAWWTYLRLWVLPVGQSLLHDAPADPGWAGPVAVVGLVGLGAAAARWGALGPALVGAAWLLPSSLVPLKEVMAEHRAYLLGLPLAALLAGALRRPRLAWAVVAVLAVGTGLRNRTWATEVALWGDAAAKNPASADAAYGHADALRFAGDLPGAEAAYRRTLELRPGDENARVNLGIVLADLGRVDEARTTWQALLRDNPRSCPAHNNLASLEVRRGRLREAAAGYASTLRWCPDDPLALYNLGHVYRAMGDPRAARAWYQRYLDEVPLGAARDEVRAALDSLGPGPAAP